MAGGEGWRWVGMALALVGALVLVAPFFLGARAIGGFVWVVGTLALFAGIALAFLSRGRRIG